jgi:hypothetical protein
MTVIDPDSFSDCAALEALRLVSGHESVLSYIRFQPAVRIRVAVLQCLKRLRDECNTTYGKNVVESAAMPSTNAEREQRSKGALRSR